MLTQILRGLSLNFNSLAQLISLRVHFLLNHRDHTIGEKELMICVFIKLNIQVN